MKNEQDNEVIEETSKTSEKPKKKGKAKLFIILGILFAIIIAACIFILPKIKEDGISGVFGPKLNEEQSKLFDLYYDEIVKYKDCEKDYKCFFELYYLEGVENPVIAMRMEHEGDYYRIQQVNTRIFYIKEGKVTSKLFLTEDSESKVTVTYNVEKDELDYYLVVTKLAKDGKDSFSYTLFKDIVTENENPYSYTFSLKDEYTTTYKSNGQKVAINKGEAMFVSGLDNYVDNKVYDHVFSFVDGEKQCKKDLKKAIKAKFYLKDILNNSARETALERISYYNIKPGQVIVGSTNTTTTEPVKTDTTEPSKPTTRCNSGFVYVKDDNRCYSNSQTKPMDTSCKNGYVNSPGGCAQKVDASLCESGNDQYENYNGNCIDRYTDSSTPMDCPKGYEILFGSYGGKDFNGACYKWEKPNY